MTRRTFLAALASVPIVGAMVPKARAATAPKPIPYPGWRRVHYATASLFAWQNKDGSWTTEHVPGRGSSLVPPEGTIVWHGDEPRPFSLAEFYRQVGEPPIVARVG